MPLPGEQPQVPQQVADAPAAPEVPNYNPPPPPGAQQEVNILPLIFPFPRAHISSCSCTVVQFRYCSYSPAPEQKLCHGHFFLPDSVECLSVSGVDFVKFCHAWFSL